MKQHKYKYMYQLNPGVCSSAVRPLLVQTPRIGQINKATSEQTNKQANRPIKQAIKQASNQPIKQASNPTRTNKQQTNHTNQQTTNKTTQTNEQTNQQANKQNQQVDDYRVRAVCVSPSPPLPGRDQLLAFSGFQLGYVDSIHFFRFNRLLRVMWC